MEKDLRTLLSWRAALTLGFFVLVGVVLYSNSANRVVVRFSTQASTSDRLQVFHDAKGHFAEANSQWAPLTAGVSRDVALELRGQDAMRLRLDPPFDAVTVVCDMRLGREGVPAQYEVLHTAGLSATTEAGCVRLQVASAARDPQYVLRFVGRSADRIVNAESWYWILISACVLLVPVVVAVGYLWLPKVAALARSLPALPGFGKLPDRAHWVCAALMLVFGMAYLVITPPGAVPDEEAHLAKIIRISQGVPLGNSGAQLMPHPRAMYGPFVDYPSHKQAFTREEVATQLRKPLVCKPTSNQIARGANGYFPHQYLLSTAAYMVGCATHASFGWFLYVARALNLLLATALVTWGVACASRGKLGLLFVALLPMSLFQMSSISADSLVLSLSIAWLGVVSGIASGTLTPKRAAAALWGLSLAIAFLKPGSAWILVALAFCKPAYDAAGASFRAALGKHLLLPWVIHIAATLAATGSARAIAGVDAAANLQSLTSHPAGFLYTVAMTLLDQGDRLAATMVGVLGWLDVPLSSWAYWTAGVLALAAVCSNSETTPRLPRYVVPLAWLAIVGSLVMTALPLFIYWTPSGAPNVLGLQGRYFLITTAFALVWCSLRSPLAIRTILAAMLVVGLTAINLDAIYRLYEAYFVVGRQ